MEIILFLTGAIPILIIVGLVFYYGRKIFRWTDNNHSDMIKYELTITEKRERYALLGASAAKGLSNETSPRRYYFTGVARDGQVIKGQVPFDVYDRLREGRRCFITMQGTRFVGFEKTEGNEADE